MKIKKFTSEFPPQNGVFIGMDPSLTSFGICALDIEGNYQARVFSPQSRGPERLAELKKHVEAFMADYSVIDVAMEGTVRQSPAASVLGEVAGVMKEFVFSKYDITMMSVPPTRLKKYVTGRGTGASKDQIMLYVFKKWDASIEDNNAADAYGVSRICAGLVGNEYEASVILAQQDPKFRL